MAIFQKFTDTVFYKRDSELEYQINALKKINSEFPSNEKIMQKLKLCELGLKGEKEIEFELKNSNIGMYVLHDINIEVDDIKAQIDYIIITPGFVYFVECKNLIGNITINNRGEFIREYYYGNRKIKEGIYSPLRQAERHIEVFKKAWKKRNSGALDMIFREKKLDYWYRPLAIMANSKNILDIKFAPKNVKEKVIRSDSLINYIINDIKTIDNDLLSNKKQMHELAYSLLQNYNNDIDRNYEDELREWIKKNNTQWFKSNILNIDNKKINNEIIKKELIDFRKSKSKEKKIPAYYIFTNKELDKMIEILPKDIEKLSKVLTGIKLKLYGKEIIDIIKIYA